MIRFATFHVELAGPAERSDASGLHKAEFVFAKMIGRGRRSDHSAMIRMLFDSARRFHPGCGCDILTDPQTQVDVDPDVVTVHRSPIDTTTIMLSRLSAQIQYLRALDGPADVVLLDSDMLINGDLSPVFAPGVALAVTVRDDPQMPVNGGIFFVSGPERSAAIAVLERVRQVYRTQYVDQAIWWGDQMALRDVVMGDGPLELPQGDGCLTREVGDATVGLLACEAYNYSPPYHQLYRALCVQRTAERVLHFKGVRKRAMRRYWRAYLQPDGPVGLGERARRWAAWLGLVCRIPDERVRAGLRAVLRRLRPA